MTAVEDEVPGSTRLLPVEDEPDACTVLVRDDGEIVWQFNVQRIVPEYSHLHANVGLEWLPADKKADPRSFGLPLASFRPIHVDWRSGSSIETFERRIKGYFGKERNWAKTVQLALNRIDEFIFQTGDLQDADILDPQVSLRTQYLIKPIWPMSNRPVIWYGQGEAGKGVIATAAAHCLVSGQNLGNLVTRHLPRGIVYVDYEDSYEEFNIRLNRFANGLGQVPFPNVRRFDPHGRLFIDIVHQLKGKVAAIGGADAYIIDSAIPACRGDVVKPEPVGAFFQALQILGKPAIVIAHETKDSPTSAEAPFGSQLWRTSAAMTVNFAGSNEAHQNLAGEWVRDVLLRCTKANNVPRFSNLAFQMVFTNDEAPESSHVPASTWVRQMNPTQVAQDLQSRLTPLQQLVAALAGGNEFTVRELTDRTSLPRKTVENTLDRNQDVFASYGGGRGAGNAARWQLIKR